MSKNKSLDTERFAATVARGSIKELQALRVELVSIKNRITSQIDLDRADELEIQGDLVSEGVEPPSAVVRARADADHNWRARAHTIIRIADVWLIKVNTRLKELAPREDFKKAFGAIKIAGAGSNANRVADAINHLIARGAKVLTWSTHGDDLVVLASVPSEAT